MKKKISVKLSNKPNDYRVSVAKLAAWPTLNAESAVWLDERIRAMTEIWNIMVDWRQLALRTRNSALAPLYQNLEKRFIDEGKAERKDDEIKFLSKVVEKEYEKEKKHIGDSVPFGLLGYDLKNFQEAFLRLGADQNRRKNSRLKGSKQDRYMKRIHDAQERAGLPKTNFSVFDEFVRQHPVGAFEMLLERLKKQGAKNFKEEDIDGLVFAPPDGMSGGRWHYSAEPFKNTYVEVSASYNPTNHCGPRGGKYRSQKVLRQVTFKEPKTKNKISFDVLFDTQIPGAANIGNLKLKKEGNLWFVLVSFWESRPLLGDKLASVDLGWRKEKGVSIMIDGEKAQPFYAGAADNRATSRWNKRHPEHEIHTDAKSLADFQSQTDTYLKDFKATFPESWQKKIKYLSAQKLAALVIDEPELAGFKEQTDVVSTYCTLRDNLLKRTRSAALKNRKRLFYEKCLELLRAGVKTVVIEKGVLKSVAEKENTGDNFQRFKQNRSNANRQDAGWSTFISILKSYFEVVEKNGAYTSSLHNACGFLNEKTDEKTIYCEGCGKNYDRDENANLNLLDIYKLELEDIGDHPKHQEWHSAKCPCKKHSKKGGSE